MTTNKSDHVVEATGTDIDEAIAAGLERLGAARDEVAVEVIDEGSRGFLGLGGREAVVRLTLKEAATNGPASLATEAASPTPAVAETEVEKEAAPAPETDEALDPSLLEEAEVGRRLIETLLQKVQVEADVSIRFSEPDDLTGRRLPIIDIHGRDLGVLIGPRGDTLDSLQYLARLMASHQLQRRTYFIVDVAEYRERRKQALARLAERMAGKAVKARRAITLEPMPPNERRVIHVTLREHPQVTTHSIGEGRQRRVRILYQES